MKTLLLLEISTGAKTIPWLTLDDNFYETERGILTMDEGLDGLETLQRDVDEVWECDSLFTRANMRRVK